MQVLQEASQWCPDAEKVFVSPTGQLVDPAAQQQQATDAAVSGEHSQTTGIWWQDMYGCVPVVHKQERFCFEDCPDFLACMHICVIPRGCFLIWLGSWQCFKKMACYLGGSIVYDTCCTVLVLIIHPQ